MRPRRYLPASAVERDVLESLHVEARRTQRPFADVVAEALNRYVAETDHLRMTVPTSAS